VKFDFRAQVPVVVSAQSQLLRVLGCLELPMLGQFLELAPAVEAAHHSSSEAK